jgi:hypothetical protein
MERTSVGWPEVCPADYAMKALWVDVTKMPSIKSLYSEDYCCILDHFLRPNEI